MKRILIIGSPGTGKTTFAIKLAKKTGLPLVHLDLHYHDKTKDYYQELNKPAWYAKVDELIRGEKWIIDGNYNSTLDARVARADTIIFFDFPRRKALTGILRRWGKLYKVPRTDMPEDWKEHLDYPFLKYIWKFNKEKRPKIRSIIFASKDKTVIVFKKRRDADKYLEQIG